MSSSQRCWRTNNLLKDEQPAHYWHNWAVRCRIWTPRLQWWKLQHFSRRCKIHLRVGEGTLADHSVVRYPTYFHGGLSPLGPNFLVNSRIISWNLRVLKHRSHFWVWEHLQNVFALQATVITQDGDLGCLMGAGGAAQRGGRIMLLVIPASVKTGIDCCSIWLNATFQWPASHLVFVSHTHTHTLAPTWSGAPECLCTLKPHLFSSF